MDQLEQIIEQLRVLASDAEAGAVYDPVHLLVLPQHRLDHQGHARQHWPVTFEHKLAKLHVQVKSSIFSSPHHLELKR